MQASRQTYGDLNCYVMAPEADPRSADGVVILCHGFGAPGDDLVPLAGEMVRQAPQLGERLMFVFPAAPLTPPELGGGRAWWPIDMMELQRALDRGEFRDRRAESPELLPQSREMVQTLVEQVRSQTGLPLSRIVLGGFSQGAMLATDVSLRLEDSPAGLIVFSGTLLCQDEWRRLAPGRSGLRVFQSHGTLDPLLPFAAAEELRDLLAQAGLTVEFHAFPGMHTIDGEGMRAAVALLKAVLPPRSDLEV